LSEIFSRTEMLIGTESQKKLMQCRAAVFGVGGVGSYATEALARAGIGDITLVDSDIVSLSNINRQLIALHSTVGRYKTDIMKERILDINPDARVTAVNMFYTPENADELPLDGFDVVIDCIDTVTSKLELITRAYNSKVKIFSSMGAGNKLDPTAFEVCDIYKTSVCPLARVMRRELKKRGVQELTVVYSKEEPKKCADAQDNEDENPCESCKSRTKIPPGSISFVPSAAGLILASETIKYVVEMQAATL